MDKGIQPCVFFSTVRMDRSWICCGNDNVNVLKDLRKSDRYERGMPSHKLCFIQSISQFDGGRQSWKKVSLHQAWIDSEMKQLSRVSVNCSTCCLSCVSHTHKHTQYRSLLLWLLSLSSGEGESAVTAVSHNFTHFSNGAFQFGLL